MITDFFSQLNWAAIAVATLAWFGFSAVWYSVPPLSGAWARAARVDTETDREETPASDPSESRTSEPAGA